MAILGRGRVRTRQLSSVLPIYLFSVSLLALAMEEKRKIRGQRRQRKQKGILVPNCNCWEGMVPWYLHFCPGVEHYVLDTSLDEVYFALQ